MTQTRDLPRKIEEKEKGLENDRRGRKKKKKKSPEFLPTFQKKKGFGKNQPIVCGRLPHSLTTFINIHVACTRCRLCLPKKISKKERLSKRSLQLSPFDEVLFFSVNPVYPISFFHRKNYNSFSKLFSSPKPEFIPITELSGGRERN